ncbi:MAG TPA: hypothetical protein VFR02_01060, partial [bacterium]|nr:hypothetical protein [bacterium]
MMKDGQVVPTTALRAALLLLAVSLAAPLFASDEAPAPLPTKTAHRPQLRQILKQLGLSPAQRHQVAECRASYRKKMAELNGQLKVKQVELENELDKTDP